jgi:type II secretory pathway pseudopilin PulG
MQNTGNSAVLTTSRSAGYTLAELAICLCIVGILMSGSLLGTSHYFKGEKTEQTRQNIDFVMNVLSAYAQTHDRLPCPAKPKASAAQAGREEDNCTAAGTTEGILPWKELAIPQDKVVDGWGRPIIYRPAPGLTVDTQSAALKDTAATNALDVHNACRSVLWYDADGNHLNRAKALFCCNAPPRNDIGTGTQQVVDAASLNSIEPAAGGNPAASAKDPAFNGSFSIPRYMDGPASPLLQASIPAVTLASMGGPDKPILYSLRSDQLFARAGSGSCGYPPSSVVQSYSCHPQNFRADVTGKTVKDPVTGLMLQVPPLYGVNLVLAGNKYQLRASLTKSSDNSLLDDSVGFYAIKNDGSIGNVQMLVPSVKNWPKGETDDFSVDFDENVMGIGLFVVPDGYRMTDGYKNIDLTHLKFVPSMSLVNQSSAMITDQSPPLLVSYDPATGFEKPITGAGGISAYHLYGNLNPGKVSHTLRSEDICHMQGEKVGANHDFTCARATTLEQAGVDPAHPAFAQVGFEDSATINCYEYKDGGCRGLGSQVGRDLIPDNEGGYIASIGDNTYDNVAFSIGLTSCPEKQ